MHKGLFLNQVSRFMRMNGYSLRTKKTAPSCYAALISREITLVSFICFLAIDKS